MSVSEDNVIYANFGTRKRVSRAEETKPAVYHLGSVLNPVATQIAAMFSRATDSGRLSRGRHYAQTGHVVDLDIRNGAIHGKVAGSQNQPFEVLLYLPYRTNDDLEQVYRRMADQGNALRNARDGQLDMTIFGLLFAPDLEDIRITCTCPDVHPVCKHVVAVADRLAARVDSDPMTLFEMRGIERTNLERGMMSRAQEMAAEAASGVAAVDAKERARLFWEGRPMPDVPSPKKAPAIDDSDPELLRKAFRAVSHTSQDLLRAVSDFEELYEHLTR